MKGRNDGERVDAVAQKQDDSERQTWRPDWIGWMLIGYLFFLPMQFRTPIGFRFAPSDLFLLLTLLLTVGKIKFVRAAFSAWHYGLVLLFALGLLVAVLRTGDLTSYALVQKMFGLLLLIGSYVLITWYAQDWQRVRGLLTAFICSVTLQNLAAMGAFFAGLDVAWLNDYSGRLSGMLIDPNAYGGLLVVTFALHVVTYYRGVPLVRGLTGLLTTLTLSMGIFLTFSRSSWIGMTMVLLVLVALRPALSLRIVSILFVGAGSVLLVKGTEYLRVVGEMATRSNQIESRFDLMNLGFEMFWQAPVFGAGLGTFFAQHQAIIHNTLIWVLVELGVVGLAVFLGFLAWFILRGLIGYRRAGGAHKPLLLGLLLAHFAMLGLSLGIEATYQRHWWLVLALLAAGAAMSKTDKYNGTV